MGKDGNVPSGAVGPVSLEILPSSVDLVGMIKTVVGRTSKTKFVEFWHLTAGVSLQLQHI